MSKVLKYMEAEWKNCFAYKIDCLIASKLVFDLALFQKYLNGKS